MPKTPAARKPRRTLTPADVTRRYPSFRSGRMENWEARSRDGIWDYKRLEISGTPWVVLHRPSGLEGNWYGTLPAARAATADGTALASIERIQDHERGEHGETRDPRCVRC